MTLTKVLTASMLVAALSLTPEAMARPGRHHHRRGGHRRPARFGNPPKGFPRHNPSPSHSVPAEGAPAEAEAPEPSTAAAAGGHSVHTSSGSSSGGSRKVITSSARCSVVALGHSHVSDDQAIADVSAPPDPPITCAQLNCRVASTDGCQTQCKERMFLEVLGSCRDGFKYQ